LDTTLKIHPLDTTYKVYWFIDKVDNNQPLPGGIKHGKQSLDAPVIFDLVSRLLVAGPSGE
jgi:hypothetical protein